MLGGLVVVLIVIAIPALQARNHLAQGRSELLQARRELASADAGNAVARFEAAQQAFIAASSAARNPMFRIVTILPILGRSPDTVVTLAEAGRDVAEAGAVIARSIEGLDGGFAALAPRNGRVDLAAIRALAASVDDAAALVDEGYLAVLSSADSLLAAPVADARRDALATLADLKHMVDDGRIVLDGLPAFLGGEGQRRYLFAAQNPAELRGTGGLIGVYSVMTTRDGSISLAPFEPIGNAPVVPPGEVPAPNADYERIYNQFGGATSWSNGNMTPDLPAAAAALEAHWEAGGGTPIDGVVMADPAALAAMLGATGPVEAPSLGVTLTEDNVVGFVTNEVYSRFSDPRTRKEALGVAAGAVIDAFLGNAASPEASFQALRSTLAGGHLQVYSDERELQGAFTRLGIAGALTADAGDFLSLVQNNAGANKIDFYLQRSIGYSVRLGAEGTASGTVDVLLRNDAPLRGAPKYVLGPFGEVSDRGENVSILQLFCAEYCSFAGKSSEGGDVSDLGENFERGHPFTWDYVRIPSRDETTISYRTSVGNAWGGDEFGGNYRFTFLNQATIRPTELRFEITVPEGMEIVSTSVPMQVQGSTAVWEGTPSRSLEIEVRFRPPPLRRAWAYLWHVLSTPL